MSFVRWTSLLLATAVITLAGCGGDATDAVPGDDTNTTAVDSSSETLEVAAILCGKCGEEKGADSCCAADAEVCECGMHKGTKLCCATLADADKGKDICSGCGHVAEANHTCPDGEVCEDCGLHVGSAACCKLKS